MRRSDAGPLRFFLLQRARDAAARFLTGMAWADLAEMILSRGENFPIVLNSLQAAV